MRLGTGAAWAFLKAPGGLTGKGLGEACGPCTSPEPFSCVPLSFLIFLLHRQEKVW